jgi:glycosyltransferase involved in cell wall biosynthesis
MSEPLISVVIPSRNRIEFLRLMLEALDLQQGAPPFEVVVADNASTDGTAAFLAGTAGRTFSLKHIVVPRLGVAPARNRGVETASAARVLLLDDDTFPGPRTIAAHVPDDPRQEIGIQGLVDWDRRTEVTPFMEFIAPEGHQFYFKNLRPARPVPYSRILGCNLSAPLRWFQEEPFDESFTTPAFEDTELGYRWRRRRWVTIYRPEAICWHRHYYRAVEPFLERQRRVGQAVRYAVRKHPGLIGSSVIQPFLVGLRVALQNLFRPKEIYRWDLRIRLAFFRGFFARGRLRG